MTEREKEIYSKLSLVEKDNREKISSLNDKALITDYTYLIREGKNGDEDVVIWTEAFQKALDEHEVVIIPKASTPYYIDNTVVVPSNRHIEAENGAVIRLLEGVTVLLLRNKNNVNGARFMPCHNNKDFNISVNGGRWEEYHRVKAGYGKSGKYDRERSYYGVSSCMFFNNVENVSVTNVTVANAGGFAIQIGEVKNGVFENISFENCFADGLHINGNTENVVARNIKGNVGDDLVALNMYDWQDSSVNFGPAKTILCENLELVEGSRYKAMRLLPGIYYFDDGTEVDCSLDDIIIDKVKGINTFKLYLQTAPYKIGEEPEKGKVGSADNIFFKNIEIDLDKPVDIFDEYTNSDPVKGTIAGFELGANIGYVSLENIDITLHRDKYPMSYLLSIGPKTVRFEGEELFDPQLDSVAETVELKNIKINDEHTENLKDYVREIVFDDIYGDGNSTAKGKINNLIY